MAKRLQINFHRTGPTMVDENGQPRPCAMGVAWVHEDTLATLRKKHIQRTDPKGQPIAQPASGNAAVTEEQSSSNG